EKGIRMTKKLFVFECSPAWDYCGGMVVVVASDYEEAIRLAVNHVDSQDGEMCLVDHKFYANVSDIPDINAWYFDKTTNRLVSCAPDDKRADNFDKRDGWDEWVLSRVYD